VNRAYKKEDTMDDVYRQDAMLLTHEQSLNLYLACSETQDMLRRPRVIMKPKVYVDGDSWCCLYGDNLMEGVSGFGATPELACRDFDEIWAKGCGESRG